MVDLVNADGTPRTYVVTRGEQILAAFDWAGRAAEYHAKTPGPDIGFHNLTHPKIPDWLKAHCRADQAYCQARAAQYEERARAERAAARVHSLKADEYDRWAADWLGGLKP